MFIEQKSYYDELEYEQIKKSSKKIKKPNKKLRKLGKIVLVLCVGIIITSRYVAIEKIGYSNQILNKQYANLLSENKSLKVKYTQAKNLTGIENTALTKLNMVKPDQTQLIYIDGPKLNKADISQKKPHKQTFLNKLWAIIK